jgi:hypothetical protein
MFSEDILCNGTCSFVKVPKYHSYPRLGADSRFVRHFSEHLARAPLNEVLIQLVVRLVSKSSFWILGDLDPALGMRQLLLYENRRRAMCRPLGRLLAADAAGDPAHGRRSVQARTFDVAVWIERPGPAASP